MADCRSRQSAIFGRSKTRGSSRAFSWWVSRLRCAGVFHVAHLCVITKDLRQIALGDGAHADVVGLLRRIAEAGENAVLERFEFGDIRIVLVSAELGADLRISLAQRTRERTFIGIRRLVG